MATVKLLTYDVYRSGMTLFKNLADETYQTKAYLPEYFLRKLPQSEVPVGYDTAYRLVYRVAGDPFEHVNGDTIGIVGSNGGGVIMSYIVGNVKDASWLSDVPSGTPFVPTKEFLYLIMTAGNECNCLYRFDEISGMYILVQEAVGDGAVFVHEIAGKTPLDADWLTDSTGVNPDPIIPKPNLFYLDTTPGKYLNNLLRFDFTTNKYVKISGGGGGGAVSSYIVGSTPFAPDWLSDSVGGAPLTPEAGLLYLVLTEGQHYSAFYRYDETNRIYILVGNARVIELTKAEYLNLPAAKKNDGTIYFITDSAATSPTGDDYIPSRVTVPSNPSAGMLIMWQGAVDTVFKVSPAFYRYNGSTWVQDDLGIEGQTVQYSTLPVPAAGLVGSVYQYVGESTSDYIIGNFYTCVNDAGTYKWVPSNITGHQIKNDSVLFDQTSSVDFVDFNLTSVDAEVTVKPHVVTSDEWDDIFEKVPHDVGDQFCYSLEEQVIGTWIDGKPLYQKTLEIVPTSTDYLIDLSSLNIEYIISGNGWWSRQDNTVNHTQYPVTGRNETPTYNNYDVNIRYTPEKKLRVIISGYEMLSGTKEVSKIRYTIQYTKTTD